ARLQQKDAGDDLQAVRNPMAHLAQQRALLLEDLLGMFEQVLLLLLRYAPVGDVLDRQQNHPAVAAFVADREGVELDRAPAPVAEILLELESFKAGSLRNHGREQLAQARDVPLPGGQLEQRAAVRGLRILAEH